MSRLPPGLDQLTKCTGRCGKANSAASRVLGKASVGAMAAKIVRRVSKVIVVSHRCSRWPLALNRRADEQATLADIVEDRAMLREPVVPKNEHVLAPADPATVFGFVEQ